MTEKEFVKRNKEKWEELEKLLTKKNKDADQLHDLFIKVSSDLSYARTFFPNRSVRQYLNNLTNQVFNSISKDKRKFQFKDIIHFYRHTLPIEVYRQRKAFLVSLIVFVLAVTVGVISSANNEDFLSYIIGDEYVEMTKENINEGDPMKVYKDEGKIEMFMGITLNNITVAFNAFVWGLLGTVGTVYILMYNGIMLGAFQYFFFSKGLFWTSFLTIWIHGAIEISAIIIAGAAGIVLGNGILFPKTYNRITALQISAQRALVILLGVVPLFVIAGLLEGFVTRLTELPVFVKAGIIILSLIFVLLIFVIYPWMYNRSIKQGEIEDIPEPLAVKEEFFSNEKYILRGFSNGLSYSFARYRNMLFPYIGRFVLPVTLVFAVFLWGLFTISAARYEDYFEMFYFADYFSVEGGGIPAFFIMCMVFAGALLFILRFDHKDEPGIQMMLSRIKQHFPFLLLIVMIALAPIYFIPLSWSWVFYIFLPPHLFIFLFEYICRGERFSIADMTQGYSNAWKQYGHFFGPVLICGLIFLIFTTAVSIGPFGIVKQFFTWHHFFEDAMLNDEWIDTVFFIFKTLLIFPLFFFILCSQYYTEICKSEAVDMLHKFETFGSQSEIFEIKKSLNK